MNTGNIPDKRADGLCCDCIKSAAVTKDGRFCLKCLRRRVRDMNPISKAPVKEQVDRKQRDLRAMGGSSDMRETDDVW